MTTRPTDEEIRARFAQLLAQRTNTSSTCHIDPMRLKELRDMWLAERQAARDGVTGEIVESIVELACRFKNDEIESVDDLYPLVRAALQSIAQPVRVPDEKPRAYMWRRHGRAGGWEMKWQPISTAPHGIEILAWREDCGIFLAKYTSYEEWATDQDCDEMDEATIFQDDWWGAWVHPSGFCRLEGDVIPTHWMPLPEPPEVEQ